MANIEERRDRSLAVVDGMPPELREVVHEYGYAIVDAFLTCKIRDPATIRHLVRICWEGARSPADRTRKLGGRTVLNKLDWVLVQAGCPLSAKGLVRVLADNQMGIVPLEPSKAMIEASMTAPYDEGWVTKPQKHRLRLRAAINVAAESLWPFLKGAA